MVFRPRVYSLLGESRISRAEGFWERTYASMRERCDALGDDVISIDQFELFGPVDDAGRGASKNLAPELGPGEVVVAIHLPNGIATRLLERRVSVVLLTESDLRNPRCATPLGFYDMAATVGRYLAERLTVEPRDRQSVLAVGGMMDAGEAGRSRLAGLMDSLEAFPQLQLDHIPTGTWHYDSALPTIRAKMRTLQRRPAAIFGLTDPLALAARDVAYELGLLDHDPVIIGINGDPEARSAIFAGEMTATIDIGAADLGVQAADLAHRAIAGEILPPHFPYRWRWIDHHDISTVWARGGLHQPSSLVVRRAIAYIHRNFRRPMSRTDVAAACGVHPHYLSQLFAEQVGTSLWGYVNRYRVERAQQLLTDDALSVRTVAQQVGYSDPAYFSRVYRRYTGASPRRARTTSAAVE